MKSLRILITGGSSGIGAATAELLATKGHRIFLMARNTEAMHRIAKQHPDGTIECAAVDVREQNDVKAAVDRMVGTWGGIDDQPTHKGTSRANDTRIDYIFVTAGLLQNVKGVQVDMSDEVTGHQTLQLRLDIGNLNRTRFKHRKTTDMNEAFEKCSRNA